MSLTRDFNETIRARSERDPKFRKELLRESIECLLAGDIATAKAMLRDYINARQKASCGCSDRRGIRGLRIFLKSSAFCSIERVCGSS